MKKRTIRSIGKPTEPWQKEAIHMYQTRLQAFGGVDLIELPEGHGKTAKPDEKRTRSAESDSILKSIDRDTIVIALDQHGKMLDSKAFSQKIIEWESQGNIVFIIGGSWGLDESILKRANFTLSFGAMTLPHNLAKIVLLEQIYRAKMIENGKEYHK
jgi:23S rRNA (pseudouridine1915-N3)-methyltransferase